MIIDGKEFRPYDENYYVSADGDVYSAKRDIILKHWIQDSGHHTVHIRNRNTYVHHLVYLTWIGPIPNDKWVLHCNDNKDNNHYSNLYLGTPTNNNKDSVKNSKWKGEKSARKTATVVDKRTGLEHIFSSRRELATSLGFYQDNSIRQITSSPRFREQYELIRYGKPILRVLDKDTNSELTFESAKEFLIYLGFKANGSVTIPRLQARKWFRDRYEIL